MSLFGNLFRAPGSGGGDPPVTLDGAPVYRQIATEMANQINGDSQFDGITAQQVNDPKRKLSAMTAGDVLVDCIGVGVRSTPLNRRFYRRDYLTHAAIRARLSNAQVTGAILDELGTLSEAVQSYFELMETIELANDAKATLIKAEPFAHVSREQLYGAGVFLCPIEYTWTYHPPS